jgi:hypothetical protein
MHSYLLAYSLNHPYHVLIQLVTSTFFVNDSYSLIQSSIWVLFPRHAPLHPFFALVLLVDLVRDVTTYQVDTCIMIPLFVIQRLVAPSPLAMAWLFFPLFLSSFFGLHSRDKLLIVPFICLFFALVPRHSINAIQ